MTKTGTVMEIVSNAYVMAARIGGDERALGAFVAVIAKVGVAFKYSDEDMHDFLSRALEGIRKK